MNKVYFFLFVFSVLFSKNLLLCEENSQKTVLVVGGAGFVGSHVNEQLYRVGYSTVVLDNLSKGNSKTVQHGIFVKGDINDDVVLDWIFSTYKIDAVMHFAAFTDVGESVLDPLKYYSNNVTATMNLLRAMLRHQVKVFIFSSSAAIFGITKEEYIAEDHPCHPINPYGQSKLIIENILPDLDRAYGLQFCCLRYFNATGGDPEGVIKNYKTNESNLIPILLKHLKQSHGKVTIFGTDYPTIDGTGVRDYIHIADLATAHIAVMEKLITGAKSCCYNLGNGKGYSVKQVIAAVEKVTGQHVNVIEGPRRPGDPAAVIADCTKAQQEFNWQPRYTSLEEMIEHAWKAIQ